MIIKRKYNDYKPEQNSDVIEFYFANKVAREQKKKHLYGLILRLFLTAIVVYTLFGVVGGIAVVQGTSMEPTITNKSVALFFRHGIQYKLDDIVIIKAQGRTVIKRVVATARDTVDIDNETGALIINGKEEHLLNAVGQTYPRGNTQYPITIPDGYVFVLGDNREDSVDSRDFGLVSISVLIGKAIFTMGGV